MSLNWQLLILLIAATGAAALLQSITGFGYALLVNALLATFRHRFGLDLPTIVLVANVTTFFCQFVVMYQLRGKAMLGQVWTLMIGAAVTIPVGLWLLATFGRQPGLVRVFGAFVAAVAIWMLLAPRRPHVSDRPRRWLGFATGLLTGLVSGMFNTGGPPTALYTYSRPIPLESAKVTLQWVFTGTSTYRLALTVLMLVVGLSPQAGRPDLAVVAHSLLAIPTVMACSAVGVVLARKVHPELMRRAVFVLLIVFGLRAILFP